mgnify:CR=1 FL=1
MSDNTEIDWSPPMPDDQMAVAYQSVQAKLTRTAGGEVRITADLDEAIRLWPQVTAMIRQGAHEPADFAASREALIALAGGEA